MSTKTESSVPQHVGLIIDGNRRWAKQHGLPPWEGHLAGVTALEDALRQLVNEGVKYISFYTWSTENWKRAEDEVTAFMGLIRRLFKNELKRLLQEDCKFIALGEREGMPADILQMIEEAEEESKDNNRATLVMCFNYGGQQEIATAARHIVEAGVPAEKITNELFSQYIDHPEVPPCDLIVRTSGEERLSNFMLWRSAYSELIFVDKFWPDIRPADVTGILEEYNRRNRRHGG